MTTPVDPNLRVNLDQLQQTSVQWKQSAAGMQAAAPPPVTTQGWPSGTMTAAIHGGAEQTTSSLQAGMAGSAEHLSNSADTFHQADQGGGTKLADVIGPVKDIISLGTGAVSTVTGAVGSLGGVLSSFISTTLSSALKGGQGQGQQDRHPQNPANYDGGDHDSILGSGGVL